jgi:hypothetical protein
LVESTASRISQSPDFRQILAVVGEIGSAQANAVKDLSVEQNRGYVDRANALRAAAEAGTEQQGAELLDRCSQLLGLSTSDARDLLNRLQTTVTRFATDFPDLRSMPEREKLDVLTQAIKRDSAFVTTMERLVAAADSEATCRALCYAFWTTFVIAIVAMYIVLLLGCVWLSLIPPLLVLCLIAATAVFTALQAVNFTILQGCLANCEKNS